MAFIPIFEDAERLQCKAAIMIEGLTGKGKSGLALIIAHGLAGGDWSKVSYIDTENKSANLFVGIESSAGGTFGKFKVCQLTPDIGFRPSNYLICRNHAIDKLGAEVVIEDSISHAWQYQGGVLDLVNEAKRSNARYAKDNYAAWSDETVTKEKNELLNLIRDSRCHVITTVRVKEKFEYVASDEGKTKLNSLGEQQIQQSELKYEPDLVLHMLRPGKKRNGVVVHPLARVVKSRYAIFDEGEEYEFTPELILQLKAYLEEGADPNELLEKQRLDYVQALKEFLDTHPNIVPIWKVMKKDAGCENIKLEDISLDILKTLYIKITTD
jgi:hypothetical protein